MTDEPSTGPVSSGRPVSPGGPVSSGGPGVIAEALRRCTFPPGDDLRCAVSGGADSLCLLVLAVHSGRAVTALHVDHGLRPGSSSEAGTVERAATALGAAFVSLAIDVPPGPNLEARAREARYGVLPPDIATGHTMDDLAETVALNLLWGAGLDGLAPMRAEPPFRPLLGLRRSDSVAVCAAAGLTPLEDPMNRESRYRRVRVRRELLPLLADIAGRDPIPILARQARLLGDESALLDELAARIDPSDASALRAAAVPLARRAVRQWLVGAGVGDGHPPESAVVERVLHVARGDAVGAELHRGWRIDRSKGRLRLSHRDAE